METNGYLIFNYSSLDGGGGGGRLIESQKGSLKL
jgi:hypothetical protein